MCDSRNLANALPPESLWDLALDLIPWGASQGRVRPSREAQKYRTDWRISQVANGPSLLPHNRNVPCFAPIGEEKH